MSTSFAGVRNFAVGAALVLVAKALRRTHAAKAKLTATATVARTTTHSERADQPSPGAPVGQADWADLLERELDELAALADQIYGISEFARHEEEVGEDTFVRLDDLRWILGRYILKGGRVRRLIQLPELLESLAAEEKIDAAIDSVGTTGTELLHRMRDTNSVTVDWLLAHRVALPDPDFLDSNALMDRYNQLEFEPTTVSGDPLYLLTCHIHDMLETTECLGAVDHSMLDRLEVQLAKPVIAVAEEIKAAIAFNDAVLGDARHVIRTVPKGLAV